MFDADEEPRKARDRFDATDRRQQRSRRELLAYKDRLVLLSKYLQQLGMPFSHNYMEDVLVRYAKVARRLVEQFELQFRPGMSQKKREIEL